MHRSRVIHKCARQRCIRATCAPVAGGMRRVICAWVRKARRYGYSKISGVLDDTRPVGERPWETNLDLHAVQRPFFFAAVLPTVRTVYGESILCRSSCACRAAIARDVVGPSAVGTCARPLPCGNRSTLGSTPYACCNVLCCNPIQYNVASNVQSPYVVQRWKRAGPLAARRPINRMGCNTM